VIEGEQPTLRRWATTALALGSWAVLSACAASAGDGEQAIVDQSHGRLTEPECEEFDTDTASLEKSFECSAAQPGGRRIKLMVFFAEKGRDLLVLEWRCISAGTRWKAIRRHPALRCGKPLPAA
jgi:hypothetical protein